jgi:hypothetical protein
MKNTSVIGTLYAVVSADLSHFAYINTGWVRYDTKVPRKSGSFDHVDNREKILARFQSAVDSEVKQQGHHYQPGADIVTSTTQSEILFKVVKVTIEEAD